MTLVRGDRNWAARRNPAAAADRELCCRRDCGSCLPRWQRRGGEPDPLPSPDLGVALLPFLVGLRLDWGLVKALSPVALATGLGQVAFTAGIGFIIALALGLDWLASFYVAVALTFSSTILMVNLLGDRRKLETLHGRIALGLLMFRTSWSSSPWSSYRWSGLVYPFDDAASLAAEHMADLDKLLSGALKEAVKT